MGKLLIKNATVINEGNRLNEDILIEGDLITSISKKIQIDSDTQVIDAHGLILIPGMIDDQVHFREPGLTHKGNILSESKAAIAGGVTSYIEMPNTSPNTTTVEEFNKKMSIASINSYSNFSFMFGGTNDNLDEIKKIDPTEVAGIKLFLGSSTGKMLIDNLNSIEKIFSSTSVPITLQPFAFKIWEVIWPINPNPTTKNVSPIKGFDNLHPCKAIAPRVVKEASLNSTFFGIFVTKLIGTVIISAWFA